MLLQIPLNSFLPTFYAQESGIGLTQLGAVFFLARLFDMLLNPIVGVLSDNTRIRFGRRRLWTVVGAPVVLLACWFVFFPAQTVTASYILLWIIALQTGCTIIGVAHYSWAAELSTAYDERTRIAGVRDAFAFAGVLLGAVLLGFLASMGHNLDRTTSAAFGVAAFVSLPIFVLIAALAVKDDSSQKTVVGWRETVAAIRSNKSFQRLMLTSFCIDAAAGVTNALSFLYIVHYHRRPDLIGAVVLANYLTIIVALPLWVKLSQRTGKHRACAFSLIWLLASAILLGLVPRGAVWWFVAVSVFSGAAYGGALMLPNAMTADTTDYDLWRHKQERAGLFFSIKGLAQKAANAAVIGAVFPVLALAGFDAALETNTDFSLDSLWALFSFGTVPFLIIAIALLWNFPLDARRHGIIQKRLARRL